MEDDSADEEPHFEVGKEVAEDEDGDGGGDPTGAIEEFGGVARGVVNGLSDALPLHGEDDEDGQDGCGAAETSGRADPSPESGEAFEERIQQARHEPLGWRGIGRESTTVALARWAQSRIG